MKVAGIDIGTNSMRLILAKVEFDGGFIDNKKRVKEIKVTRMGEGVDRTKIIADDVFSRNMDSFKYFVDKAKKNEAERIFAIGTSALRDARNSDDFVFEAKKHTGVDIEVIDGELEAKLGFYGVVQGVDEVGRILIIDIGGGSTEFIVGSKIEGIIFKTSIDVGAVRLTELYGEKIFDLENFVSEKIKFLDNIIEKYSIKRVIGIGGSITTASAIKQFMDIYDSDKVHNSNLSFDDIIFIQKMLASLNLEDRKKVVGLQPERADIILSGISILKEIMKNFKIADITVSEYDNLEGMLYYYLKEM